MTLIIKGVNANRTRKSAVARSMWTSWANNTSDHPTNFPPATQQGYSEWPR
jgi:hypothetical protein